MRVEWWRKRRYSRRAAPRKGAILIDQILSGLSNLLATVLVARTSSQAVFGDFMMMYSFCMFAATCSRSFFGTLVANTSTAAEASAMKDRAIGVLIVLTPGAVLVAVLFGLGFLGFGAFSTILLVAFGIPFVLFQDLLRFAAVAVGRPWVAVASDAAWVVTACLSIAAAWRFGVSPVLLWVVGAVIASLVAWIALGCSPRIRSGIALIKVSQGVAGFRAVGAVINQVSVLILLAVTASVLGSAEVGAMRGAGSLMAPVNMLMAFAVLAYSAVMFRSNDSLNQRLALRLGGMLSIVAVGAGAVLNAVPQPVGEAILGDSWSAIELVVPWTALGYAALGVTLAGSMVLVARSDGRSVLLVDGFQAGITLMAGIPAVLVIGTAVGVQAATSVAAWLPAGVVVYLVARRHPRTFVGR